MMLVVASDSPVNPRQVNGAVNFQTKNWSIDLEKNWPVDFQEKSINRLSRKIDYSTFKKNRLDLPRQRNATIYEKLDYIYLLLSLRF